MNASMDATARALAEPTRRAILELVRDEELPVKEIADHFPVSRPAISQHLRVLQEADLVDVRDEGTRRYYRARPEGLSELRLWLEDFWRDHLQRLKLEVEQEQWRRRTQDSSRKQESSRRSSNPSGDRTSKPEEDR
jgi:DNA-binding transcriptional ArsR family regulator